MIIPKLIKKHFFAQQFQNHDFIQQYLSKQRLNIKKITT
jgi:hypothetical protein